MAPVARIELTSESSEDPVLSIEPHGHGLKIHLYVLARIDHLA